MISAMKAETLRLASLRSTLIYAILLTGALYGPPILLVVFPTQGSRAISAGDLGQCALIFLLVSIAFAGSSTATEIRRGATGVSFLTQRFRWPSFVARLIVIAGFLTLMYALGLTLALGISSLHPQGFDLSGGGWAYMGVYLLQILFWAGIAISIAVFTRSTVAAVALPMVWLMVIESLVSIMPIDALQKIAQWTPFNNWSMLLDHVFPTPFGGSMITHGAGYAVLALVVTLGLFIAGGWVSHSKRDIPA